MTEEQINEWLEEVMLDHKFTTTLEAIDHILFNSEDYPQELVQACEDLVEKQFFDSSDKEDWDY